MTHGVAIIPSILITLVAGSAMGIFSGVLIHDGRVPPFIATLGMMTAVRGLLMLISGARMIAGLPRPFLNFAQINILWMPSLFFVWLVVIVLSIVITTFTRFGRNVFAIGRTAGGARV